MGDRDNGEIMRFVKLIDLELAQNSRIHSGGVFTSHVLSEIAGVIGKGHNLTAETSSGKSTILFSNLS